MDRIKELVFTLFELSFLLFQFFFNLVLFSNFCLIQCLQVLRLFIRVKLLVLYSLLLDLVQQHSAEEVNRVIRLVSECTGQRICQHH